MGWNHLQYFLHHSVSWHLLSWACPKGSPYASAEVLEPRNWGPGSFLLLTSRQLGHGHITAEQPGNALGSKNNCQNQNICKNTISPLIQEYHHEQSCGADSAVWIVNLNLTMLLNWAKGLTSEWAHLALFIANSSTLVLAQRFPMASAAPESVSLMCLHLTSDLSFSVIFSCSLTGNPTAVG